MSISPKARLITFEGIDGCGKTTQAKMLLEKLNKMNVKTILVREPGGTRISEAIREILLTKKLHELEKRTEALLMTASRAQLTDEVILPNLEQGNWVIADRYSDSTLAYQGGGRELDVNWLVELNSFATNRLIPDFTVLVDILPEEGVRRRIKSHEDRIENAGIEFQQKVRNMYLELVRRFQDRIYLVDGHQSVNTVHENIWNEIKRRFFS